MSNIFVNGSDINRMQSLSSLINNMIYKKSGVSTNNNSAIQNSSLSTLQAVANNNKIDTSYSSYINDLQSTIDSLNNRAASVTTKLSDMTSLKSSYNKTATTLDAFINSIKNSSANSIFDYTNTNGNAINVDLFNNNTTSQRIDYNIIQAATATTATSNILKGVSVNKDSKIVDLFAGNYTDKQITGIRTDINGATTMAQLGVTTGTFEIGGNQISINSSDTVDDVIAKLQMKGYEAGFTADNKFYISSETESLAIRNQNTNFAEAMGLTISKGTFTINGQEIYITDSTTVGDLLNTINSDEKYGVGASLVDNKIQLIANQTGNVLIEIGKGSSNFTNAVGFTSGGVMRTDNLVIGYDEPLSKPLTLEMERGQKIALTGANGIGKTTLLKSILGLIPPLSGTVELGDYLSIGYFEQEKKYESNISCIDEIWEEFPSFNQYEVRSALAKCGLTTKHIESMVKVLSGGEQAKVRLCKLINRESNILLLDEPTNHLDVDAKEELKRALKAYKGSILLICHEPEFYQDLATDVWNCETWTTKHI